MLQSKPRAEERLYGYASVKGFDVFYPRLAVKRVNPRARGFESYFPGYLFVRTDLDAVELSAFQWMPFALGLVCFDGQPATVPDALIYALQQRLEAQNASGGLRRGALHRGDALSIVEGPFAGYEALFDSELSSGERVRVLLRLLNDGYLAAELPAAQILPKRPPR